MPTTHIFKGDAPDVSQVATVQVTAYDAATTYILTINGKQVSTIAAGSANATATALAAAWNASTNPEMAEVTAEAATDTVTFTGDTAGVPFAGATYVGNTNGLVSSVSGGAGTIGAVTTTTAPSGKNWWAANNFDTGSLPIAGDTVYFRNSNVPLKYGLSQAGATLAALHFDANFTADVGLPRTNNDGSTPYTEYRLRYLTIDSTIVTIGNGSGNGSGRIMLNLGSVASTVTIFATASSKDGQDVSAVQIKGTSITDLNARGGTADVAPVGGEVATITTLDASGNAFVRCSSGVGLTTVNASQNADVITDSAITTLTSRDQARVRKGSGAVTTWNALGSNNECQGSGTITTLTVGADRSFDASSLTGGVTITNATLNKGCTVNDSGGRLTWTNAVTLNCALDEITWRTKQGATVLVA